MESYYLEKRIKDAEIVYSGKDKTMGRLNEKSHRE